MSQTSPADPSRRSSRLTDGVRLVVADLHNHSLHSDGLGDPARAFAQLRAAGLDVAALTDHASIPQRELGGLSLDHYPDAGALAAGRLAPRSLDEAAWKRTAELADAHDVPGEFTALRGFEWTEPWLGHVNVWFSSTWTPVSTPGTLAGLFDFLDADEPDALFGYNHPGREPGTLHQFALPGPAIPRLGDRWLGDRRPDVTGLARRMVGLEIFNRTDDFLFDSPDRTASPIAACLNAGWRPALIGSSDEHGRSYGLVGKGRTGLWVREHSRAGVREALLARRAFATREVGLLLDATLDGEPIGGALPDGGADVELAVDLALDLASGRAVAPGSRATSAEVRLELLGPDPDGGPGVQVLHQQPAGFGEVTRTQVRIPDGTPWALLRVSRPTPDHADESRPGAGRTLAYATPWYRR